jgi:hypothetical protein
MNVLNVHLQTLHDSIARGDLEKAKALLTHDPGLLRGTDFFDDDGTLLHKAAAKGYRAVAELLLDRGADVNAKGRDAETPLHRAAGSGHTDVAELLLARGADVNAKGKWGEAPLHRAALSGHRDVAELLLARGADVNAKGKWGEAPLHNAAVKGSRAVVELLLASGADVNAGRSNEKKPFREAMDWGHEDVAGLLVANGADPEQERAAYHAAKAAKRRSEIGDAWKPVAVGAALIIGAPLFLFAVAIALRSSPFGPGINPEASPFRGVGNSITLGASALAVFGVIAGGRALLEGIKELLHLRRLRRAKT